MSSEAAETGTAPTRAADARPAGSRPVEALWRTLLRWDASKIVPPVAIRNTVGFALAFIIGTALGNANSGVLAALGALNVSYSDGLDPYILRARRIVLASVLCGIAVTAGALSGHSNAIAVITAALGAFAAGMLLALGTRAGDLGVVTLVTLVVFAARPLPFREAVESGLVAIAGGLLQALLSVALWPVKPYKPERRIISGLYRALADIAAERPHTSTAPPVTRQISDAQEALASLARDHSLQAERLVFLLNQAERIRLSLINLTHLHRRIARERSGEELAAALEHVLQRAAKVASDVGDCADGNVPVGSVQEFENAASRFRSLAEAQSPSAVTALVRDAIHELDALGGQIRAAAGVSSVDLESSRRRNAPSEPWYLRFPGRLAKLFANLSFDSTVFRHALRLALCLAIGDALGRALTLQRTYWIPMTIAIVLKPDFTTTFSRGILRIAGTLVGLSIATVLFHHLHTGLATDIALMTIFMFLLRWVGPANYGVFVAALSSMVVLLIATTGVSPALVISARAQNTAIGGALALLAYAVWPTWEKTQVGYVVAEMVDRYREYFSAVVAAFGDGAADRAEDLSDVRNSARLARSNAEASVDRLASEPGVTRDQIATLGAIMASSHAFVHAVMALEAGLYHTEPTPIRPATRDFAREVDDALRTVSLWLRGVRGAENRSIPDLRAAHRQIIQSGVTRAERYTLVDRETDRITTSTNTLAERARAWLVMHARPALQAPNLSEEAPLNRV